MQATVCIRKCYNKQDDMPSPIPQKFNRWACSMIRGISNLDNKAVTETTRYHWASTSRIISSLAGCQFSCCSGASCTIVSWLPSVCAVTPLGLRPSWSAFPTSLPCDKPLQTLISQQHHRAQHARITLTLRLTEDVINPSFFAGLECHWKHRTWIANDH